MKRITALVVTFNRCDLLRRALAALRDQTVPADNILVVDNASTDGTSEMLHSEGWLGLRGIDLLKLKDNFGGAGGFAMGLEHALSQGADWVWMMDDDAEPHPNALERLIEIADNPLNIYGSLAVAGLETAWITTLVDASGLQVSIAKEVPKQARVQSLPFLGFLIHENLVSRIGLPEAGYFIAADDVEYCIRAQSAGADIIVAGESLIEHPPSRPYTFSFFGVVLTCLALPPWKRYYDTRNRILIAKKHHGWRLLTRTIPGSFGRLFAALLREPNPALQAHAFIAGFIDGVLGLKGKRHLKWRIHP